MIQKLTIRLFLLLLFCAVFQKRAEGQEYPWSLQYIFNMNTINPAYAGMWDEAGLMVSTRTNWVGFAKNPLFQEVSYHTPIKNQKSGWGMNVRNMNTGREKQLFVTGDYSLQLRMDWNHYLRFGLRGGVVNFDNHMTDYQLYPDYIPDLEFNSDVKMFFMSVLGLGGVFFNEDYFISLSIPQVINNTFSVNRNVYSSTKEFKTAYLSGGYVFKLPKSMRLRPNLLCIATVKKPVYYDASVIMFLPNDLQFGLSMRSKGELCFSGQYVLSNGMRIGYAADYAIGQDIRKYQVGTYEIVVGYDFNIYRKRYVKPNYF